MNENYELSRKRAEELFDKRIIDSFEIGTYEGLRQIHEYLFQDSFGFAGKMRDVNLSKGNFRFAPVRFLESNVEIIENMPEDTLEEMIEKYVEMNVAHPFREGNGRSMRIWLDQMLKKNIRKCVDWSKIDKESYLSAMERSPINDMEIRVLIENALTDEIDNREVYMEGIKRSYEYEGYYGD